MIKALAGKDPECTECVLRTIEQGFPVTTLSQDVVSGQSFVYLTEPDAGRFRDYLDASLPFLLADCDGDKKAMIKQMESTEPFSSNWPAVNDFLKSKGWLHG